MFTVKHKHASATINMCKGPILPVILKVAVPLMLTGLLQTFFNAADIMVLGKFGSEQALAGVSSTSHMIALIINIFMGISIGSNVICARFFGGGDEKQINKAVHTSIAASLILGAFLTVFGFFSAEYLLRLIGTPESVMPSAVLYMQIYFLGMIPMLVYNFAAAILRAVGDTKRPLYFLTVAGATNVILNLILVVVFKLDVAGVAIATSVSNAISAICCVGVLVKATDSTHLDLKKLRIDGAIFKEIVRIGLPAGIQSALFCIANVIIQSSLNTISLNLGAAAGKAAAESAAGNAEALTIADAAAKATSEAFLAGNGAGGSVENFVFTPLNAIDQAVIAFTGQNYGKREYKRIVKAQGWGVLLNLTFGMAVCVAMYLASGTLLKLYVNSPEAIIYGVQRMKYIGLFGFVYCISNVFIGGMRGCGYSVISMFSSIVCICGFRLVWIYSVFNPVAENAYETLLTCYPISYILSVIVQGILLFFVLRKVKKKLTDNPI